MDINEATAKALQAARAVTGLTYEEVSEKSGVSIPTIYRMFGAKRDIKLPQLHAVANALGVTVVEVMQDAERIRERDERNSGDDGASQAGLSAYPKSGVEDVTRRLFDGELAAGQDEDIDLERKGGDGR